MKFLISALLVLLFTTSHARIGESQEEIEKRYGKSKKDTAPLEPATIAKWYLKSGLAISVGFLDGKSCYEFYMKGERKEFSDAEIEALLEANQGKSKFKKKDGLSINPEWETEDGKTLAHYSKIEGNLTICSQEWMETRAKIQAEKEKKNLNGF